MFKYTTNAQHVRSENSAKGRVELSRSGPWHISLAQLPHLRAATREPELVRRVEFQLLLKCEQKRGAVDMALLGISQA